MAVSWPFNSTVTQDTEGNPVYSRSYNADVIARILGMYFRNGVFTTNNSSLQVLEADGMTVDVEPGDALINGHHFYEETTRTLTVQAANATLDRIDSVVLRLNLAIGALTIDLYVVQGTPATTPTAPSLTRNASIYEIGLANLFITKNTTTITQQRITDTRLDSDRCGVVASIIGDTNTTTYYTQLGAVIADAQAEIAAAILANQGDWDTWFASVVDVLDENTAGNLLNLINQHAAQSFSVLLAANGWSSSAPYTQTVSVDGILSTDTPLVDVVLSATAETALLQIDAYVLIGKIDTADGSITVTCYKTAPDIDLTLAMKVVR